VTDPTHRPLVIAANRLPVTRTPDGWTASPGGLVRALLPLLRERRGTWVGWTGMPDDHPEPFDLDGVHLHPIGLSSQEIAEYYEGFSNDTLWPLYHDAMRDSGFHTHQWEAYRSVNERFAATLAEVTPQDAIVWIHDYHLQLVPAMLREHRPDLRIGYFNHIPFPPYELFARLPWRSEIVEGLLGADLVGFQRRLATRNLAQCAQQFVQAHFVEGDGIGEDIGVIEHAGRHAHVGTFPISIDVDEFETIAAGRATRQRTASIRARLGEPEVVLLGVDRLDYTKGIGNRLQAFGALLDAGRLDAERHVLVQVATPTREGVDSYQEEKREIDRLVGDINGRHARLGYPVVHYLYRSLPLDDLVPLYRAGDVMLVTPFRDGMNLVAKEYVATRLDDDGVLVLSEFTGAADELRDAVLVNPHDDLALQDAIVTAVEMHRRERRERMERLRKAVRSNDVGNWARTFLDRLLTLP
jgi:alpha,alpha-trehalose-phosphate synthase [UDP-forming]